MFFFNLFFLLPQQVLTYIVVYTYSKIKSHKKSYKIFDFKSRDSTFYVICQNDPSASVPLLMVMAEKEKGGPSRFRLPKSAAEKQVLADEAVSSSKKYKNNGL